VNAAACRRKLVRRRERRTWYRAFDPRHALTPLSSVHTIGVMFRFSPGNEAVQPFEILHFSESHDLTLWEMGAVYGSIRDGIVLPNPTVCVQIINVEVDLQQIGDLTVVAEQAKLRTSVQELTGDWKGYQRRRANSSVFEPRDDVAPTQVLGEAMFAAGFEGFRAVSAKVPDQMNLVVFPQNLIRGSRVSFVDTGTGQIHEIVGSRQA
jgi:hypothetical protein